MRELGKHGGDRKSEKAKDQPCNTSLKYGTVPHFLARLTRDRPDLAAQVQAGKLSANAAAIEAGWRKKLSALEQILRLLPKLTPEERTPWYMNLQRTSRRS